MPTCRKCQNKFPNWMIINGKKRNLHTRKYCTICSPFGKHNTKKIHEKTVDIGDSCVCLSCDRKYKYDSKKGHTTKHCNSCNVQRARGKVKDRAVEYKGGKCEICGYRKCTASLCFHHTDPSQKDFTIGDRYFLGWSKIKKELDKCILVCQNCHHEIHANVHKLR